ncbi:DUF4198 domain-containing protein [Neolewinella persica]|uniref:DUF4198 domain-containing protein n=1 Tax=Neolewinella persica TaxID=70998 RepID=UPI00036E4101|nr:DUF4198 domain-containing protein [Neolewinella persica]
MKKLLFVLAAVALFSSHDMYLKLDSFFLQPNTAANIQLFNGTFDKSENAIARNRMIDVSLVGNGTRTKVDTTQWSDQDNVTILSFTTGDPGTWVAGVSTRARDFGMEAQAFNDYLKHDGVLDMLKSREENGLLDEAVVERYSKHVKTIFQVGSTRTDDWQTALDYPIEFVPISNPYDLHAGDMLKVKLLWQGQPLAGQLVYVDSDQTDHGHSHDHGDAADHDHGDEHAHEHGDEEGHEHGEEHGHDHGDEAGHDHDTEAEEPHHHDSAAQYRTDAKGEFSFKVTADGIWHVRTIYLVNSEEPGLTHESNWATLTFEVDHGQEHSHAEEDHDHAHEANSGIPGYAYWGGSLLLIASLFFVFMKNAKSE